MAGALPGVQIVHLRSQDRVGGTVTDPVFNLTPAIDRCKNWKLLEVQCQPVVGPVNNTTIDVVFDWSRDWRLATQEPRVEIYGLYPSLGPLVQTRSLYGDYVGWASSADNFNPTELEDIDFPAEKPTPAPFLYTRFTPYGYTDSGGGTANSSAAGQLAMCIQLAVRKAIAQGLYGYNTQPTYVGVPTNPQLKARYLDTYNGYGGFAITPANDSTLSGNLLQHTSVFGIDTTDYAYGENTAFDTWAVDVPGLFHIVPPGATITHLSTTCQSTIQNTDGTYPTPGADTPLNRGTEYVFTNRTSRYAFVFMPDDGLACAQFVTGSNPLDNNYPCVPWILGLSFRINGELAKVLGVPPGEWVDVPGLPPRATNNPFVGAPGNIRVWRWPLRVNWNYSTDADHQHTQPTAFLDDNAAPIAVPANYASYAPKTQIYITPKLDVYCSLLLDHQTMRSSFNGELSTLLLQVPLGDDGNAVVQYQNNTSDFPNRTRQEVVGQFSLRLGLDTGEELNSQRTLPPGTDLATVEGALFTEFPDWSAQMAFES